MKEQKDISIIVAIAANQAIGKDNDLLWHISADLKRFKQITEGNPVIMGKRTFYSLPRRPLPNRLNMVITDIPGETIDGCVMAYSIEDAIEKMPVDKENFIIGGGSIYAQFLPKANRLYITRVFKEFEADTFFPGIPENEWELISEEKITDDVQNDFNYSFEIYKRKT
ncbi:MAG: dihydrofolate reductase [Bacteroidetes bacterium]|nr:dihydrofolate reductase [Bacteroidota bacterium]